ncbi:2TM domain-containing protein [Arenibacter sp. F20364]|uniref:2TM domain-containing protein n=1 Tax=Arenibacter sp. F20364 TaxID=2926415 RepID=UPI001FF0E211|nr:2TM domain-containing protein [Arenibacter sp. F20364]MCK0190144.1 2TM domain-containing protein [Arenibacter sp. F20364]
MENIDKESKYFRAKERVEAIKKFYLSLMSYFVFIGFLAALNYWTDQWRYPWFLWAAFGWGIGLVFKAVKVFGLNPFFGKNWEERKIREFMQDDERENRWK